MSQPTPEEIQSGQDLANWMQIYEEANGQPATTLFHPEGTFDLVLQPGAEGYIVINKRETRRQRFLRWILRRDPPVEVYPVKVKG